jgi:hypothetical protein
VLDLVDRQHPRLLRQTVASVRLSEHLDTQHVGHVPACLLDWARRHRVETARSALSFGAIARLDQGEESGCDGRNAHHGSLVLLRIDRPEATIADLAARQAVHPNQIYGWKRQS